MQARYSAYQGATDYKHDCSANSCLHTFLTLRTALEPLYHRLCNTVQGSNLYGCTELRIKLNLKTDAISLLVHTKHSFLKASHTPYNCQKFVPYQGNDNLWHGKQTYYTREEDDNKITIFYCRLKGTTHPDTINRLLTGPTNLAASHMNLAFGPSLRWFANAVQLCVNEHASPQHSGVEGIWLASLEEQQPAPQHYHA